MHLGGLLTTLPLSYLWLTIQSATFLTFVVLPMGLATENRSVDLCWFGKKILAVTSWLLYKIALYNRIK